MRKFPNIIPTRLRNALNQMSNGQRKAIRLPHVGAKEIARHDRTLNQYGCFSLDHDERMYQQNPTNYIYRKWETRSNV